jgi:hypothetical protein
MVCIATQPNRALLYAFFKQKGCFISHLSESPVSLWRSPLFNVLEIRFETPTSFWHVASNWYDGTSMVKLLHCFG